MWPRSHLTATGRIRAIEPTIFAFIRRYSTRDQVFLLIVTLALFPLLYATLELPKQIINGALGADQDQISIGGVALTQISYLLILCGAFLLAVTCHGLLKMRINTMKGRLSERLLRRFRYGLIARMLRFPGSYFEQTSEGELVSIITAESEPMGGLMGDALAQPVLQAGQMLTILGFLFAQSVTFGLAACAMIPVQGWLIPRLQQRINRLNKQRIIQLRALAGEIGESAQGASTLRLHGGWRYRLALITDRLERLYALRFEIYQKKFFMKFTNNLIGQLTPFLFYAVGGVLVIRGEVSLGALVAALAAYKDLASPWKELLQYYNQVQEMSLRWTTITDRFAPAGMLPDQLFDGQPDTVPDLTGDIRISHATVRDSDGNAVLEDIDVTLPGGALIGVAAPNEEDRRAFAQLLTREVLPSDGQVQIGDHGLGDLHQVTIASRIGHASSRPILFEGNFGDNLMLPLRTHPLDPTHTADPQSEAARTGNSPDPLDGDWLDLARADAPSQEALLAHWCDVIEQTGDTALFRRAMDQPLRAEQHPDLASQLVALRPTVADAVTRAGLNDLVLGFDPDGYNPALPVVQNLLFATPFAPLAVDTLGHRPDYLRLLQKLALDRDLLDMALGILDGLRQIFGTGGADHPLFRKTAIAPKTYQAALQAATRHRAGKVLKDTELAVLLSVASSITAELLGPAFPDRVRDRVVELRKKHGQTLRDRMQDLFAPILTDGPVHGQSVLENLVFGKLSDAAGARAGDLRQVVADTLRQAGLSRQVLQLVFDMPVARGGTNLPSAFAQSLAFSRAAIKRPDILVLDHVLDSFDTPTQAALITGLRAQLPRATIVHLAPQRLTSVAYDTTLDLDRGRLIGAEPARADADTPTGDLVHKMKVLEQTRMFSGLDRKQLRLLAFGARWYPAEDGHFVFRKGDPPTDGVFVLAEGQADLLLTDPETGAKQVLKTISTGDLVGELGLIRGEPRALDMRANGDLLCLRLGEPEFLAVVENDAATAFRLLQIVAGYVRD